MKRPVLATVVVVAGAAAGLLAGPRGPLGGFWRPLPMQPAPAGVPLAGLTVARLAEAVGLGLALAVLVLGRPIFTRLTATGTRATVAQLATGWLLGSWLPHSALHMHLGVTPGPLAAVELSFHAGSIVAAAALLWALATAGTPVADTPAG